MNDDPNGFESGGFSETSQNSEEIFLTTVTGNHGDEPRCGGTTSRSVNGYTISEHENDEKLKPDEKSIQKDEVKEKLSTDSPHERESVHERENGDQTDSESRRIQGVLLEWKENRQYSTRIDTDAIKKEVYDEEDVVKEYTKHGNISTLAHKSDHHIDDATIDILVDNLLNKLKSSMAIKDGRAKKFISKFLIPKLEKYGKESLKEICSLLLKGDIYDVLNHQPATSTIVMPVTTGKKKFAAANEKLSDGVKAVDGHQEPLDQAHQLSQRRQAMPEPPTSECSENHDCSNSGNQAVQGSSGDHLVISQSDPPTYQYPLNGQGNYNSNPYNFEHHNCQYETFDLCGPVGAVGEGDPQLPLSQDETRRQRRQRAEGRIDHRRIENMCTSIVQSGNREQNNASFYLTNQQYQLRVKVERQRVFVTVVLNDTDASQHARKLELADHIKYWKYQLIQLNVHPETHTFNNTSVIVAYGSVPSLVDGLTSQGFVLTSEADIDPVALLQLQQQENFINMVFLSADEESDPLAILSQTDPGSFDNPRNGTLMQFVSELGNPCGTDSHMQPLYKKDKVKCYPVEPTDAADSSVIPPLASCFSSEFACTIEDIEKFTVNGAVRVNKDKEDGIPQCHQPCSELSKQHCMQEVAGTTCHLPARMPKETGAMITGTLPILPQITSDNNQSHESLNVKYFDTPLPEPDSVRCKKNTGEKTVPPSHKSNNNCFLSASCYDMVKSSRNSK